MKKLLFIILFMLPLLASAEEADYTQERRDY